MTPPPPPVLLAVFLVSILAYGAPQALADYSGSVSLDRSTYPVPFGGPGDAAKFRYHDVLEGTGSDTHVGDGALTIHIQINEKDVDTSVNTDTLAVGPGTLTVEILRGPHKSVPASAAGLEGTSIRETSPTSGIFEVDLSIRYDDGPPDGCPTGDGMFREGGGCLLSGDTIIVRYTDPDDAAGNTNTVTDSAAFELRDGTLQADKDVYLIGSDMILTLTDPDLNLDSDAKQSYPLDLIAWKSDAATLTMGLGGGHRDAFDPEPMMLQETGDNTNIFQAVIAIPSDIGGSHLDRGEEITLEYIDRGPSGADFVGQESINVNTKIYTTNKGAVISLDQSTYTWTDRVFITIMAEDHNFDSNQIDHIGSDLYPVSISTGSDTIENYRLAETGADTGIFRGEVTLTGSAPMPFEKVTVTPRGPAGTGPTDGVLPAVSGDKLTVSFKHSIKGEPVKESADIRWKLGDTEWLKAAYEVGEFGTVRIVDPDMNLNPDIPDGFKIRVGSDTEPDGIEIRVRETDETSGIFEGTVRFDSSTSSIRLHVAEGDTVTAEYDDFTLPKPHSRGDELTISATARIGTDAPPPGKVSVSNPRVVNNLGSVLDAVQVGQQVQITADLANRHSGDQPFAYIVTITNPDGTKDDPKWISGSVGTGQSFSPSVSWTPGGAGSYRADIDVRPSSGSSDRLAEPARISITVAAAQELPVNQRMSVGNLRVVNNFGSTLDSVRVNQQVQITADLANRHNSDQPFAYIVTITNPDGTKDDPRWISGSVATGQSFSPSVSWTPDRAGSYKADIDVRPSSDSNDRLAVPAGISIIVVGGGDDPAPRPEPRPPATGKQIAISDARVTDSSGTRLSEIDPGDLVQLTATFENTGDKFQKFTYVADIQKGGNSDKQYLTAQIGPKASVSSGLSWTPKESGTYKVTIYARESINSPEDLAAPVGLSVEVGNIIPPTEKMSVGSPSVGDGAVKQGQKVDVTSKITNKQDRDQRHVYIVQVADEEGTVVYITWSVEDVGANEDLLSSVSWVPEKPGRYVITTFVWSSLVNNPEALAPPAKSTVVVG